MSDPEQNYRNHARIDPVFHYLIAPIILLNLVVCAVHLYYARNWFSVWLLVLALGLILLLFKTRLYPLRAQDRLIRLEERLRLELLLPADLRPRIHEFREDQLIALRFASDDELPALAAKALDEHWNAKEIKKRIERWRPDHFRV